MQFATNKWIKAPFQYEFPNIIADFGIDIPIEKLLFVNDNNTSFAMFFQMDMFTRKALKETKGKNLMISIYHYCRETVEVNTEVIESVARLLIKIIRRYK